MSEEEKKMEAEDGRPKESKEEKKERLKKEKEQKKEQKAEQKRDREKGKEAKAATKGAKADKKLGPAGKANVGTAEGQTDAFDGESGEVDGEVAGEWTGVGEGEQGSEPIIGPEPPPKKPVPKKLLYGPIIVVIGVSLFLYDFYGLFTIPDVLWFGPFVLVWMGLVHIWKKGLFDRLGQTMLIGGIVTHFALLVWTDGNRLVRWITVPLFIVWAGVLVFAKGFQLWLKNRQPEEPIVLPEVPIKERRRWTHEDMDELLAEMGEPPDLDVAGALDALGESAADAETKESKEE